MKILIYTALLTQLFLSTIFAKTNSNFTLDLSIETERGEVKFQIHADNSDIPIVRRVETILKEDSLPILDYFEYKPTTAIHITFNKDAKTANGSASVFPRNIINLHTFPPYGNGHLITGEDWLKGLVLHELVHIVHLDQTSGIPDSLRTVFGSVAKWGGIVPRWFSEGIAMWAETHFTKGGRLRQKLLKYQSESKFSDPNFCQSIDCLDDPGSFPYKQYPYWVGGAFMNWIENQNEGNIKCLIKENSSSIPFLLNDAFNKCLGKDASDIFILFRADVLNQVKIKDQFAHPLANKKQKLRFSISEVPLFQRNWKVSDNKLIYVEDIDNIESLIVRDLFTGKTNKVRFDYHIDQIYPSIDDNKNILMSTSTYARGLSQRKIKALDIYSLEDKQTSYKGEYATLMNGKYLYLKNKKNKWHVYREDEKIYSFPELIQVNYVNFYKKENREYLSAKIVDPFNEKKYQLWVVELGGNDVQSKPHIVWKKSMPFQLLLSCNGTNLLQQDKSIYGVELTSLDQSNIRSVKIPWSKEIVQIRADKTNTVVLLATRPGFAYVQDKSCLEFIDELLLESKKNKPRTVSIAKAEDKEYDQETNIESYPRASHFLPHWWAFSYFAGAQLANWQINTNINDPRNKHNLNINIRYFPDIEEAVPTGVYNYNFGFNSFGVGYDRNYINSSLKITPDKNESTFVYLSRMMTRWGWSFLPRLSYNQRTTENIFGRRNITNTSLYTVLFKEALFADSFFKRTTIYANAYYEEIENLANFWANEFKIIETLQPFRRIYLHLQGTYAKLHNNSFLEGIIFSGGFDDYSVTSFHPFYGVAVNDAFGREVNTFRAQFDANILNSHRGAGLFPVFVQSISLLAGLEYLKTDRIFLSETRQLLVNNSLTGAHIGLRARTTLGYFLPVEFDTIINQTQNPIGDNYTSYLFLLKASFFL